MSDSFTLWTAASQAPLSMRLSRQEHWSGSPFPSIGYLPSPGIEPTSPMFPSLAGRFFTISATWEAHSTSGRMFLHFSRKPVSALATIFNMGKLVQNCELNYLMSRSAPKLIKFYITHYRLMHIQLGIEKCDDKISTAKISIIGSIREAHTSLKFLEPKWI